MDIVSCTPDDLADALAEWRRRSREEGENFMAELLMLRPASREHDLACGDHFRLLLERAGGRSAEPRRRALALGWTPPPPDSDRFWYHPDHGPVHEEDLAGVLNREGVAETPESVRAQAPAVKGSPDYLTRALARLRAAAAGAGFEVGEVTLSFDDIEGLVELKVRLSIEAGLLDRAPEPGARRSSRVRWMGDVSPGSDRGTERSYRRGYVHGWVSALTTMHRLLRAGRTPEKAYSACADFCLGELSEWRYGDCARQETPPAFDRKAAGAARRDPSRGHEPS